jgi:hypothetical protein
MKVTPVFEEFVNHLEYLSYNIEDDDDGLFLAEHECGSFQFALRLVCAFKFSARDWYRRDVLGLQADVLVRNTGKGQDW